MQPRLFRPTDDERQQVVRTLSEMLARETDVLFAYLHGSFIGEGPFHDVDVGAYLTVPDERLSARALELGDRLSRQIGMTVDLRALNRAPIPFQFRALQGTLLASRDDERLSDIIEHVGLRYLDIAPRLRRATREAFAR